jgi:hypothetical protein
MPYMKEVMEEEDYIESYRNAIINLRKKKLNKIYSKLKGL